MEDIEELLFDIPESELFYTEDNFYEMVEREERESDGSAKLAAGIIAKAWETIRTGSKVQSDEALDFFVSGDYKYWFDVYVNLTSSQLSKDFIKEKAVYLYRKRRFKRASKSLVRPIISIN